LIAQHSIVPAVGAGRPDPTDLAEIRQFAERVLQALEAGKTAPVSVPGNRPYREKKKGSATPISLPACSGCGACAAVCPTDAITVTSDGSVATDAAACMMCMACVAKCPQQARVLPPAVQEGLEQRLSAFRDVRRENEFYV
jgi:ferredoxin